MPILLYILGGTFLISLIAIVGIFGLFLKEKLLNRILLLLVGFSAGALMGGGFLHLIPEAVEKQKGLMPYLIIILGFVVFFLIEKFLHWRHCHKGKCPVHQFGYLNIIGDGVHNFIDGLIIAAAFSVDIKLGLITLIAVGLHEIPQEISDFGVLVYAGFKKLKALILNYIAAVTVILGGIVGYFIGVSEDSIHMLLPFAAGGFIYIASADLLPELKKEGKLWRFIISFVMFLLGVGLMYLLAQWSHH